jgi:hypothetical protein
VHTIAKITPADYPDLLAAVDAGISQRQLADRYECAPSLVARHIAKAKRAGEANEPAPRRDVDLSADPHEGSMREILEARIRDPRTSARDLASLTNALAKLKEEQKRAGSDGSISMLRVGTHIVEPEKWRHDYDSERQTFQLMIRVPGGIEHMVDGLTPGQVLQCLGIGLRVWTPEQLAALEAALRADPEPEYTPLTEAEIEELSERIATALHGALVSPGGSGIFAARLPPRRHRRRPAG